MINRKKTIMRFISVAMCTSLLNTTITPGLEINANGDTQANANLSEEENLDDSTIVENTEDSSNVENLVSSTTEAAVTAGIDTSTSSDYVTIEQTENGTITLDESSSDKEKGYFKYIIKPDDGYEIKNVIVDGESIGIYTYYEFKNLTQSGHTISATFKKVEKHATGYIPEFVEVPYVYNEDVNTNLPLQYGLDQATFTDTSYNTSTNKEYISPVKDQGDLGVCWAFSALGTLESSLLKENNITTPSAATYDFSENHMRYALSSDGGNLLGFDRRNYGGGNFDMALAYLTRGKMNGAVNESDDPYPTKANTYLPSAKATRTLTDISGKPVQDYYPTQVIRLGNLPTSATTTEKDSRKAEIKNLITEYGSVTLSYDSDESINFYNLNSDSTEAYYKPNAVTGNTNHAVSIVGWDDNYSVNNFKPGYNPSTPGAFLVKNNWGDTWGQNGYFYISYEDKNAFSGINAFKEIKSRGFYNNLYEYDTFGRGVEAGYPGHDQFYSNVYNTNKVGLEKLTAISTYCNYPDSYIKLYVSTDGGTTFTEKIASLGYTYQAGKGYKIDETGYYTFMLDTPTVLNCDNFAVAIEVQQANNTSLIPLESNTKAIVEKGNTANKLGSYTGFDMNDLTSKISADNTYILNTCIKAFTEDISDKTSLTSAIAAANINKTTAIISTNGADVDPANKWVTSTVMTAYTNAIATAQGVVDNASATQTQVDTAVTALAAATTTFNNAKQAGTKITASNKTALTSAITSANTNKTTSIISTNGADVDPANKWVISAVMTAYTNAIATAQGVVDNASATQIQVDTAVTALAAATTTFNNAKAAGTKVTAADKTALQSLYDANKNKNQENYTTATWIIFATALSNASTVLTKANATQVDINTALTSLNSAINGLIMKSSSGSGGGGGGGSSSDNSTTTTSSPSNTTADTIKAMMTSNGTVVATKESIAKAIATIGINNIVDEIVAKEIVKEVAKVVTENIVTNLKAAVGEGVIVSEAKQISTSDGNIIAVNNVTKDGKYEGAVITASANSTTATIPLDTAGKVTVVYKYIPLLGKYIQLTDGVQTTADSITLPTQANVVYYVATIPLALTETVTQGFVQVNNNWYIVNKTGDVQTEWQKDSIGWVYLSSNNGIMQTGWNKQGQTWYHLGYNGYMSTGWVKDNNNNTWYYLNSDGSMAHDTTIDGYHLSSDGAWIN